MPANVESMTYNAGRGMPWHREGVAFEPGEVTSWDQMRKLAGLDWDVAASDVHYIGADGKPQPIDGWKRLYRTDTGATLHVPKAGYVPHTHQDLGTLIEALHEVGSNRGIDWDTAGSLDGGKQVFAAAKLGDDWEVPGDPSATRSFLTILTSHDGTGATKGGLCNTRVVCANTFRAAEVEMKQGRSVWIKHNTKIDVHIEDAKRAIKFGVEEMERARTRAEALVRVPFTDEQIYEWIDRCYPLPKKKDNESGIDHAKRVRSATRKREKLEFVALDANPNTDGIRNSLWGVFNMGTEVLDHFKEWRSNDRYVSASLLEDNAAKRAMLSIAMDIAKTGDAKRTMVQV